MELAIMASIAGTILYFVIGVGASKLISTVKSRKISLVEILTWPICLIVFAAANDIS